VLPFQDKLTVCVEVEAGVPEPVRASVVLGCWASLETVRVLLTAPEINGLNVMENEALWPAGMVTGSARPPILKTELFVVAPVTVTPAPVAVRVPDAVPLVPMGTLPKSIVLGETANCPAELVPVLPGAGRDDPELNPWHPTSNQRVPITTSKTPAFIRV
jgi:hypothetical protein